MSDPVTPSSFSDTQQQIQHRSAAVAAALGYLAAAHDIEPTCWVVPKPNRVVVYALADGALHRFSGAPDPSATPGHPFEPRESICEGHILPLREASFELSVVTTAKTLDPAVHGDVARTWTFCLPGEPPLTCTSADPGPPALSGRA